MTFLNITEETRLKMIQKIQDFYTLERDEEIGVIAAESILDFFLEDFGKPLYNKGLEDAKSWFSSRLQELEFDFDTLYQTS